MLLVLRVHRVQLNSGRISRGTDVKTKIYTVGDLYGVDDLQIGDAAGGLLMRLDALIFYVEMGGDWDKFPTAKNVVAVTVTGVFSQEHVFRHLVLDVIIGTAEPKGAGERMLISEREHVPAPILLDVDRYGLLLKYHEQHTLTALDGSAIDLHHVLKELQSGGKVHEDDAETAGVQKCADYIGFLTDSEHGFWLDACAAIDEEWAGMQDLQPERFMTEAMVQKFREAMTADDPAAEDAKKMMYSKGALEAHLEKIKVVQSEEDQSGDAGDDSDPEDSVPLQKRATAKGKAAAVKPKAKTAPSPQKGKRYLLTTDANPLRTYYGSYATKAKELKDSVADRQVLKEYWNCVSKRTDDNLEDPIAGPILRNPKSDGNAVSALWNFVGAAYHVQYESFEAAVKDLTTKTPAWPAPTKPVHVQKKTETAAERAARKARERSVPAGPVGREQRKRPRGDKQSEDQDYFDKHLRHGDSASVTDLQKRCERLQALLDAQVSTTEELKAETKELKAEVSSKDKKIGALQAEIQVLSKKEGKEAAVSSAMDSPAGSAFIELTATLCSLLDTDVEGDKKATLTWLQLKKMILNRVMMTKGLKDDKDFRLAVGQAMTPEKSEDADMLKGFGLKSKSAAAAVASSEGGGSSTGAA